jgi:hypothetical protein
MNKPHFESKLSTRLMQAYGAACIAKFCSAKSISSEHVTALIEHLLSVLTSSHLPHWENAGAHLSLAGRGDPLPDDLVMCIPPNLVQTFNGLVDHAVEIGLVDMYGAETSEPARQLQRTVSILRSSSVNPPSITELVALVGISKSGWGDALFVDQYRRVREWCWSQT